MNRQLLDTAIRNVAARLGQSYCLYLNNKNVFGFVDVNGIFTVDTEEIEKSMNEEMRLLDIELIELQYDKYQQDKIDHGEEHDPTAEEVS